MATLTNTPTNFYVQQGNGQVYLSWQPSTGATSYYVQRSLDGVTFSDIATPVTPQYLDTAVLVGIQYWYKVAATTSNITAITPFTSAQSIVPTMGSEMSLGQLRLYCQQRADRVNSNFLTLPEWNANINQSMLELYDLLITTYDDYFVATPAQFSTDGNTYLYPLPNGVASFTNGVSGAAGYIAPPFYKLLGIDLSVNTANNAWVTVNKFNFSARNRYVYPNSSSTIYGVFNCQYRIMGSNIEFIPTPSANQQFRVWYIPQLPLLLQDTDITSVSISGWIEYVIVDAAIKALQKEESDTSLLMMQKQALVKRIEETAQSRDAGKPDTISDTRSSGPWSGNGNGFGNGPSGGV